ncbi:MAG TPA: hypothetical protein VGC76_01890 [Pyrinomonadaceae bacterium]|jgi:hypothetical protein
MKICPKCQQTYTDENLNFCLNDGAVLTQTGGSANTLPETVFVNQPRPTNPYQQYGSQAPQFGDQPQNAWNNPQQQQYSMQAPQQKSSKAGLWAVGILGVLVLLCGGGGLIGFLALKASDENSYKSDYPTPTPLSSPAVSSNITKYDMTLWKTGVGDYATTSYSSDKFTVEVTKPDYYYVVITNQNPTTKAEHETQNATTKVTISNRLAESVKYGFGLVVHSDTTPLNRDYAFVIDSENKKYRILHHTSKTEKVLTGWTDSSAIKSGSADNVLEVRDKGDKMDFYINGLLVKTVNDDDNNTSGIAGIYSSDKTPIDFSNLQIEKK